MGIMARFQSVRGSVVETVGDIEGVTLALIQIEVFSEWWVMAIGIDIQDPTI